MEKTYKWKKPKNLFIPSMKNITEAWWKELWEGLRKIRKDGEKKT